MAFRYLAWNFISPVAVAKAALHEPLTDPSIKVKPAGLSGMPGAPAGKIGRPGSVSVNAGDRIEVHLNSRIENVDGFVGKFTTTIANGSDSRQIEHGAAIIASGAGEYKPNEYAYGTDPRVLTSMEFQRKYI